MNAGIPLELIAQDFLLGKQLRGVIHVLVVAAAALGEMWAARDYPVRRRREHFDQLGAGIAALLFGQLHPHRLARQAKRDENSAPIRQAPEGLSAIGMGGESQFAG